ncbi:hypothetical protein BU583_02610 [Staphylococcus agnetis]|nr:hypothetical protein BU583_02610 [Staphylococcus agnetis]
MSCDIRNQNWFLKSAQRKNALKIADYKYEGVNKEKDEHEHNVFARKVDSKITYMEFHHLIPLSKHSDFDHLLDLEANIVTLCSHCRNLIDYGKVYKQLLKNLCNQRKDKMKNMV